MPSFLQTFFYISVIGEGDEEGENEQMHGNSEQDSDQLVSKKASEDKTPDR